MKDYLFKGFCENENGDERAFYNGEWHKGTWITGYLTKSRDMSVKPYVLKYCIDYEEKGLMHTAFVVPETICKLNEDMFEPKEFADAEKIFTDVEDILYTMFERYCETGSFSCALAIEAAWGKLRLIKNKYTKSSTKEE